jgi:hypothetical protein
MPGRDDIRFHFDIYRGDVFGWAVAEESDFLAESLRP